jgi:hypothetical protein
MRFFLYSDNKIKSPLRYWLRCQTTIHRQLGLSDAELVGSTLAAKVNAFLAGFFLL